jgi:hypothetical protein
LFSILKFIVKKNILPCEYDESWKSGYTYKQRRCTKCGSRQVMRIDDDEMMESYCKELGRNTF